MVSKRAIVALGKDFLVTKTKKTPAKAGVVVNLATFVA
jgi:hypothetical protein